MRSLLINLAKLNFPRKTNTPHPTLLFVATSPTAALGHRVFPWPRPIRREIRVASIPPPAGLMKIAQLKNAGNAAF